MNAASNRGKLYDLEKHLSDYTWKKIIIIDNTWDGIKDHLKLSENIQDKLYPYKMKCSKIKIKKVFGQPKIIFMLRLITDKGPILQFFTVLSN